MNEDAEFVKKKGIRSKHLKECSWYQNGTTCDCDLFSPLGTYAPYIPLQISKIEITNDKETKMSKKFVCKSDTIFDEFIIIEALKQSILFEKPAHEILNIDKNDLKRFILEMDGIVEQEQEESK